jgi:hypothetical protein
VAIDIQRGPTHDLIADRVAGGPDRRWVAIEADSLITQVTDDGPTELPEPPSPQLGDVRFDGDILLPSPHRFDLAASTWLPDAFEVDRNPDHRIVASGWSPDGTALAIVEETVGGTGQSITWWRDATATPLAGVGHWSAKQRVAVLTDPAPLVIVASTFVEVWDPISGTVRWYGQPGRWQITRLAMIGDTIITGDAAGMVHAVAADDGISMWVIDLGAEIVGIAVIGDSPAVATAGGRVSILDRHGNERARIDLDVPVADLASAGSDRLLVAHAAPAVGVRELLVDE